MNRYTILAALFVLLNLGDAITTQIGLSAGARELNPIVALAIEYAGFYGLYGLKIVVVAWILWALSRLERAQVIKWLIGLNFVLSCVVVWNIHMIVKYTS